MLCVSAAHANLYENLAALDYVNYYCFEQA